ncbi:MAG TPA: putative N-acetylmannosamine-6-phosphate 2-epimerase [Fimbriimonadaceae bacterium]|nr:putative N-acetylmannosamine-6-phosphate 2-epimerase [Fimbriimonadaceae bacterium]
MTLEAFLAILREQPLVVSVQASPGSAADDTDTLLRLAQASLGQGVHVLRLEGAERVARIRAATGAPVIGLIKRFAPDSPIYITPTKTEVDALLATGCEAIALDATVRQSELRGLVERIHRGGALAMGDCDGVESALYAIEAGVDLIGTTLAGYTETRPHSHGPDLALLREIARKTRVPILAEGRYGARWQVEAALRIGAAGVVVGGAINDPVKTTRALLPSPRRSGTVGAVDIGGTWLRFAVFSPDWDLLEVERIHLPPTKAEREAWIKEQLRRHEVCALGVSTGGVVDPATGEVWTAKEYLLPDHIGSRFDEATYGLPTRALDDGLATAWGHACLPDFAGRRVATLAVGTGVGCGFVADGQIWMGPRGEYSHINDMPIMGGKTCEEVLAGRVLGPEAPDEAKALAEQALRISVQIIRTMWFPDDVVIGGAVGLASWMQPTVQELGLRVSPFGGDAGLFGAAALALF